jgi:hypothetical protein
MLAALVALVALVAALVAARNVRGAVTSTLRRLSQRRGGDRGGRGGRGGRSSNASGRRGARLHAFTLIEVTMAGAILAVGAAGVLAAYSTTMGLIEHQRRLATAVNVTASRLEELLVADAASTLLAPGNNGPEIVDGLGRPVGIAGGDSYEVRWSVTEDEPAPGYIQLVVETRWVELRGSRFTRFAAYREQ